MGFLLKTCASCKLSNISRKGSSEEIPFAARESLVVNDLDIGLNWLKAVNPKVINTKAIQFFINRLFTDQV
jgi:hypothetical protein